MRTGMSAAARWQVKNKNTLWPSRPSRCFDNHSKFRLECYPRAQPDAQSDVYLTRRDSSAVMVRPLCLPLCPVTPRRRPTAAEDAPAIPFRVRFRGLAPIVSRPRHLRDTPLTTSYLPISRSRRSKRRCSASTDTRYVRVAGRLNTRRGTHTTSRDSMKPMPHLAIIHFFSASHCRILTN